MVQQNTLSQRLDAARRRQGRAIAGLNPLDEPAVAAAENADEWVPQLHGSARPGVVLRERAGQVREFESLLPAVARYYGYSDDDIRHVRSCALATTPAGELELALCVLQWRLDAVGFGFADQLPPGVARRARTQFRQVIMGSTEDESGQPYLSTALDWEPEDAHVSVSQVLGFGPALARPRA